MGTAGEQAFAAAAGAACERLLDGRGGWAVRKIIADVPIGQYRGDAFVAIHCDGSTNPERRGGSVGYQTDAGRRLATAWKAAYARRGWPSGFQPDNYTANLGGYYGVSNARAVGNPRAFIAECGFLTSPADRAVLHGPGGVDRVAQAIGDALDIPMEDDFMATLSDAEAREILTMARDYLPGTAGIRHAGRQALLLDHLALLGRRIEAKIDALEERLADVEAGPATTAGNGATPGRLAAALLPGVRSAIDRALAHHDGASLSTETRAALAADVARQLDQLLTRAGAAAPNC